MKAVGTVVAAIALASVAAQGQGQFLLNTRDPDAGNLLKFVFVDGSPATGSDLWVRVLAGPDPSHLLALEPLLSLNGTGADAGYVSPSKQLFEVPGVRAGTDVLVEYVGYRGPSFQTAIETSGLSGVAIPYITLTEPPSQPNEVTLGLTIQNIVILPEPATLTVGFIGIGAVLLLLGRRQT